MGSLPRCQPSRFELPRVDSSLLRTHLWLGHLTETCLFSGTLLHLCGMNTSLLRTLSIADTCLVRTPLHNGQPKMPNFIQSSRLRAVSDFVRVVHARASDETRETNASLVSRLQSRAWSFSWLARFAQQTKKKERLFVVYQSSTLYNMDTCVKRTLGSVPLVSELRRFYSS